MEPTGLRLTCDGKVVLCWKEKGVSKICLFVIGFRAALSNSLLLLFVCLLCLRLVDCGVWPVGRLLAALSTPETGFD
jgi:hypothetical protein